MSMKVLKTMGNPTLLQTPPPPQEESESFTCEICIEPTKKSTLTNASCCTHQYCVDCTVKYIRLKIEHDNVGQIECPAPTCTRTLDPVAFAPLVGPAVFVRWCDVLCRSALSGVDTCYCPYADCSELLLSDCTPKTKDAAKAKLQCPMCRRSFCLACKKVWHAGFGCDDVAADGDDVAFGRLAERMTWTRCPGCRHFVERRGGCRVVKCRCGIRFCYKCGKKIEGGWCNCDKSSYNFGNCCSWCFCLCWIFIVFVLPWLGLLHKHKHHTHH